ncbi:mce related family protein [Mycobacterium kansasii]|uniref:Mce related family protein n=1 Tax=Mycobacterium kansasii TaxID=1768 RepID=A0A1V3XUQ6_MYCKA|nr:mce related family protein [Mycobacterium kansasii]
MSESRSQRTHPGRWTFVLVIAVIGTIVLTATLFSGSFKSSIAVTVLSDRAGLVMDRGGKVKLRGVQVGRVSEITAGKDHVTLKLAIQPEQIRYIPANVGPGSGPPPCSARNTSTWFTRAIPARSVWPPGRCFGPRM